MDYITRVITKEYKEGLEDDFVYHIAMFGLFTKQECIESGFKPDFEKDKIPVISINNEFVPIAKGDFIVTFPNTKVEVWKREDFLENFWTIGE